MQAVMAPLLIRSLVRPKDSGIEVCPVSLLYKPYSGGSSPFGDQPSRFPTYHHSATLHHVLHPGTGDFERAP